jgi:hypothetical protein
MVASQRHHIVDESHRNLSVPVCPSISRSCPLSHPCMTFCSVVDDALSQVTPTALTVKGRISHVPVLTGATTDESFLVADGLESEMTFWHPAVFIKDVTPRGKVHTDSEFQSRREAGMAAVWGTLLRCGVSFFLHFLFF